MAFSVTPWPNAQQNQERKERLWLIISEGSACHGEGCGSRAAYATLVADSVHSESLACADLYASAFLEATSKTAFVNPVCSHYREEN